MSKTVSLKKIIILVSLLAAPGFLYYLLQEKGKNRYRPLPVLGPKEVAQTFHTKRGKKIPDTIYHTVKNFKLLNQYQDTIRFKTDSPKITITNFFYSNCPSFCGSMNKEMKRVAETFGSNKMLRFLSISVDPEQDKPEVLSEYAKQFTAKAKNWDFLTGNQQQIFEIANKEFLVDAFSDSTKKEQLIHSPLLILTDAQQRIRGYYDSGNGEQVSKLIDEVKVLITEELRKVKNR